MISDIEPSGLTMTVSYNNSVIFNQVHHQVLGAYVTSEDTTPKVMILYRNLGTGFTEQFDAIGRLDKYNTIQLGFQDDEAMLLEEDWARFKILRDGESFRLGRRTWRKMSVAEIAPLVNEKYFKVI